MTMVIVFITLFALILLGCPVFISLGFAGVLGFLITGGFSGLGSLPTAMFGQIDSFELLAIPLYILMGEVLSNTRIGKDLFTFFSQWFGRLPGGLAIATVFSCALFGAVCGVSVAGVAAIGPMAVPEMIKRGYPHRFASGVMAASGALAVLIPPSILFVVYGAISLTSVAKLFIGGIIPGIILAIAMSIYIMVVSMFSSNVALKAYDEVPWKEKIRALISITPVLILIIGIVVSLYIGIATPTELGGIGALGAIILGKYVYKSLDNKTLLTVIHRSTRSTIAICSIVASAVVFGNYLNIMRLPEKFAQFSLSLPLSPTGVIMVFMLLLVVMGMFVDGVSMVVITTPILLPAVMSMGFDPIWYGIILALNIEIAVISPPVGLNLYMMKSVCNFLALEDIIIGAAPYMVVEFIVLTLFVYFPTIALWLPKLMG